MIVENLSSIFLTLAIIWFFGGLALFSWVYDQRILRFLKRTLETTKVVSKELGWAALMLAPFSIPIVVSAICLYFG